jgi:predicted PP-loop superfamily ATPase
MGKQRRMTIMSNESKKIGQNVEYNVDGNIMTIRVDLSKEFGPSKSQKTIMVASSGGNVSIEGIKLRRKIGLNIYKYPGDE